MLEELRTSKAPKKSFIEINNCPLSSDGTLGILITREDAKEGCFYDVTFLSDRSFPDYTLGYSTVRISDEENSVSSPGESENWSHVLFSDLEDDVLTRAYIYSYPILALKFLLDSQRPQEVAHDQIDINNSFRNRTPNPHIDNLIKLAYQKKLPLVKMEVDFKDVIPFDLDYCLSLPLNIVDEMMEEIRNGMTYELLVYSKNGKLVMDDDYFPYLAYRCLDVRSVSVVHIGHPPKNFGKVTKIGGPELFPPIGLVAKNKKEEKVVNYGVDKLELLDGKLHSLSEKKETVDEFIGMFLGLAKLIQNTSLNERVIHKFLEKHPAAIDAYGRCFKSELVLKKETGRKPKYRVDLAIQYSGVEKQVSLIELERANLPIFTKYGDLSAEVNHASGQVENWLRWWWENPALVPSPFDPHIPVEGIVVIGRSIGLSDEQKRKLVHLNSHRKIKIVTYDDLLYKIEELIHKLYAQT